MMQDGITNSYWTKMTVNARTEHVELNRVKRCSIKHGSSLCVGVCVSSQLHWYQHVYCMCVFVWLMGE